MVCRFAADNFGPPGGMLPELTVMKKLEPLALPAVTRLLTAA
jgi:hypothetical protein